MRSERILPATSIAIREMMRLWFVRARELLPANQEA